MENIIKKYQEYADKINKYNYALYVMNYDVETDSPTDGKNDSYDVINYFASEIINIKKSKDYSDTIKELYNRKDELALKDELLYKIIEKEYKEIVKLERIPEDEIMPHLNNQSRATLAWLDGRKTGNYDGFLKELEILVSYYKRYIKWQETDKIKGYDVLLDEMEDDSTTSLYDEFFDLIKKEIVPLVKTSARKKIDNKLNGVKFASINQKVLSDKIAKMLGYENDRGCIRETAHPFSTGISTSDCRITTKYLEDNLFSNIYSVMHEIGHALYELGNDPKLSQTNLFGGTSCAIHESQSRFYENYLGRNKAFMPFLYNVVSSVFKEEMKLVTEEDIYEIVNTAEIQTIRIEADELTYSLHVLIRYEIEKMLFNDEISVYEIEKTFNSLMLKYLGIEPKNMTEGCFQDVHWTTGFGYFPTYALGSAISAQLYYSMKKDIDIESLISKGEFAPITAWLKEKIAIYGASKKNFELIESATGEKFNPAYYVKYLKNKFEQ